MNTHIVVTACKVWLKDDLSGGERGTLKVETPVTVDVQNTYFKTSHITAPKFGWVDTNSLQKATPTPQPGNGGEIESIEMAIVVYRLKDGSKRTVELFPR